MERVLVVVDLQRDFVDGALGTAEARECLPRAVKVVEECFRDGCDVIFTLDSHGTDYLSGTLEGKLLPVEHCVVGTEGWELYPDLQKVLGSLGPEGERLAHSVMKGTFGNVDWRQEFDGLFQGAERIELVGVCTDICVVSNALILRSLYPNKVMVVYGDACAGTSPERHRAALEVLKSCQVEVR